MSIKNKKLDKSEAKKNIINYYYDYGRSENHKNISFDAVEFEYLRKCATSYLTKSIEKINKFIPNKGEDIFSKVFINVAQYLVILLKKVY